MHLHRISHTVVVSFAQVRESAELAAEEQLEETSGRQLEEIDEQMRAWSRVSSFLTLVYFYDFSLFRCGRLRSGKMWWRRSCR